MVLTLTSPSFFSLGSPTSPLFPFHSTPHHSPGLAFFLAQLATCSLITGRA